MPNRIVIVIGGPPNSGKSTFAVSLVYALQDQGIDADFGEVDLWSPTVDFIRGKITKDERDKLKREKITTEHVKEAKRSLKKTSQEHQVVVADAPGAISDEIRSIFAGATHGIIVCREDMPDEVRHWKDFFSQMKIELIALVTSKLAGDENVESDDILKAVFVKLDRKPSDSPAMKQFGVLLSTKLRI